MNKLMMAVVSGAMMLSAFAQAQAQNPAPVTPKKNLTTVLGVTVGMSMADVLTQLQARSKRFHRVPVIGADDSSLALLTELQMKEVRLGWSDDTEMIAALAQATFFHGKVVRIAVKGNEVSSNSDWATFLGKIPKITNHSGSLSGDGCMINPIEHCCIDDDNRVLIIRDADNWNAYLEERRRLEEFFKSVPREDEVLD